MDINAKSLAISATWLLLYLSFLSTPVSAKPSCLPSTSLEAQAQGTYCRDAQQRYWTMPSSEPFAWEDAKLICQGLRLADRQNWRLTTFAELSGLMQNDLPSSFPGTGDFLFSTNANDELISVFYLPSRERLAWKDDQKAAVLCISQEELSISPEEQALRSQLTKELATLTTSLTSRFINYKLAHQSLGEIKRLITPCSPPGKMLGNACWFWGATADSCEQTCQAAQMDYDKATEELATVDSCQAVAELFTGAAPQVIEDTHLELGCYRSNFEYKEYFRFSSRSDSNRGLSEVRRFCACLPKTR